MLQLPYQHAFFKKLIEFEELFIVTVISKMEGKKEHNASVWGVTISEA